MPLLIVIGAAYLISLSVYAVSPLSYGSSYRLEAQLTVVLVFLVSTAFVGAIASEVYSREDLAKKLLLIGMLLLIIQIAVRTEVYLRAL